ncbi:MAG: SAM-dependent methyltransferase [Lentisphaeria bacterium]|nr:MAG: SAM-dependent methyltransferase [Lentisphaeria bacterium]
MRQEPDARLVVAASGDPLCRGIGGTLRRMLPEGSYRVHPGTAAFQLLAARLGEPWEKWELFHCHGDDTPLPWRRILRAPGAVLYGDPRRTVRQLAAELLAAFPAAGARRAAAGCDLNTQAELVVRGTLAELAAGAVPDRALSILLILPGENAGTPDCGFGREDAGYLHSKQMITHPEVRAIVLSKLRLPASGVLWDLGAGSGSVGIEAAELAPELKVHSVEKNPERFAELAEKHPPFRRECRHGPLCRCGISARRAARTRPGVHRRRRRRPARIAEAVVRTAPSRRASGRHGGTGRKLRRAGDGSHPYRQELLTVNVSRAAALGEHHCFKAENPITLAVFVKPEKE